MKLYSVIICLGFLFCSVSCKDISGEELLDRAIAYHDPSGGWPTFNGTLAISMIMPEGQARESNIQINLPQEYFSITAKRDTLVTTYTLDKQACETFIK